MTLVDTSVWVEHFRQTLPPLAQLLQGRKVLRHPFVIGEIAMGSLRQRALTLRTLLKLHSVTVATHEEVMRLIEGHKIYARGIGYVDAHLLAATRLTRGSSLWSYDKRLQAAAVELGVASPLGTVH